MQSNSGNRTSRPKLRGLRTRMRDRSQSPIVIVPVSMAAPPIVEIIAFAGAEAVLLDAEHGMLSEETIRSMMAHAEAAGISAVFRPRSFDAGACRQALDQGAAGVHVSHIDTAQEAQAVVDACRYAPLGCREMSLGRAVEYDGTNIPEYVKKANEDQLLTIMVESRVAMSNIEEIAAVPGIDVIHMGIADLSHDMGLTAKYDHPDVHRQVERVLDAADRNDVAVGYPTGNPDIVKHWAAKGVRMFEAEAPDYLLRSAYARHLQSFHSAFGSIAVPAGAER